MTIIGFNSNNTDSALASSNKAKRRNSSSAAARKRSNKTPPKQQQQDYDLKSSVPYSSSFSDMAKAKVERDIDITEDEDEVCVEEVEEVETAESGDERKFEREVKKAGDTPAVGSKSTLEAHTAIRRRQRRLSRQSSKENVVAAGFVNSARCWKNTRRTRRSKNGGYSRGLPKKGGAGGKGVWGLPGSELLEAYEDINDPNYDNECNGDIEYKVVIPELSLDEVRKKVESIVLEYFENGDTTEAALNFDDAIPDKYNSHLVQFSIEVAMDHKASHREMTSVLISDLYGHVIHEEEIATGFENLLSNLSDLVIDIPEAPSILGCFIARAIADDCVPPRFLTRMKEKYNDKLILEAIEKADTLFSMKHGIVRLHNVWGVGGALRPVKYLTRQMNLLLQEYISSSDVAEAARCLTSLEVPHFHHELVYEIVVGALEANSIQKEEKLCTLLKTLTDAVIITPDQLEIGFTRVFEDLRDIHLDIPLAYVILDRFVDRCSKKGFLTETIIRKMPSRGRKRFVSEGDQPFKNYRH